MKKLLFCILSLFLVAGFSGLAVADPVTDTCGGGDARVADADLEIAQAELYTYPGPIDPANSALDDWLKITIDMCTGSTVPGIVVLEVDLDNDNGTGGVLSMTGIPVPPCPIKTCAGFDVVVVIVLRTQGDVSQTAWGLGCEKEGQPCSFGRQKRRLVCDSVSTWNGADRTSNLGEIGSTPTRTNRFD